MNSLTWKEVTENKVEKSGKSLLNLFKAAGALIKDEKKGDIVDS